MPSKDVIYIESGTSIPYISFGSRMAKNLVMQYVILPKEEDVGISKIDEWNRIVVGSVSLKEIKELVSRMAFIQIEMVSGDAGFFNAKNTKALMEAWDE